jgi:hypothetical protein
MRYCGSTEFAYGSVDQEDKSMLFDGSSYHLSKVTTSLLSSPHLLSHMPISFAISDLSAVLVWRGSADLWVVPS